jgi:hypothetical protein
VQKYNSTVVEKDTIIKDCKRIETSVIIKGAGIKYK